MTEIVGRSQNFDYVEFLAEYAPYDLYALDNMGRAIELFPNFTGLIKMERSAQAPSGGAGDGRRDPEPAVHRRAHRRGRRRVHPHRQARDARSIGTHGNDAGRAAIGGVGELIKGYETR